MRVLHVSSGNLFGGVEAMLLTLVRERHRCPAMEASVTLCYEGRLSRALAAAGAMALQLPTPRASRPFTVLRARSALAGLLRNHRFDRVICHSPWTHAVFGSTIRRLDLPLVLWVHGPLSGRHWSELWARRTVPDLAICASRFTARSVPNVYGDVETATIHPPVDVAPPLLSASERRRIREELATPDGAVVIIQASRIESWKGHGLLLEALGRLRDVPDWVCWQVGGPQRDFEVRYLQSLREHARRLGVADRVRFVGERPDVARLLSAADLYCQANARPEPFGIAFVEALAAGLPVVTVAMGGAVEIIDESCGVLVPPGDPDALALALRRLIDEPAVRAQLGANAPARARKVSDPATQIRLLHDVLSRMGSAIVRSGRIPQRA